MLKNMVVRCILCALLFTAVIYESAGKNRKTAVTDLRSEYLTEPLGLDSKNPRFTWKFLSDVKNFRQVAYQLNVATSPELLQKGTADVWNSGRVSGKETLAVYAGLQPLESYQKYYWTVTVWGMPGEECVISPVASFEMGKIDKSDWTARWITDKYDKNFEPSPLFRKEFNANKKIEKARVYISGLGYYELFLNGERVGKNYLDPGYTHFDKRVLYVTHDVTELVKRGENVIAAVLGNGWFNIQSVAVWDFEKARWRNRPRMICELRLTYTDGTTECIVSDDSWKTAIGAYIYDNLYSGDMYDARLEEPGWKTVGFNDSVWTPAVVTPAPASLIVAQQMPAIRIAREITPVAVKTFSDRLYVFDMGENFSGGCRLKVKGDAGTKITVKHGELLKNDGRLEQGNISVYYHPVQEKEIFQTDVYILRGSGDEEVFMPRFSYHGFRYVEIESDKPVKLTTENIKGLFMYTDVPQVGYFSCSNDLLNRIWKATNQSYISNLHSIPTDCPQREKNGWTADAYVAVDLGLLNFDGITLYEKWMDDFIDNQRDKGDISGIIPSSGWGYGDWPGPVWDAALFIIPGAIYNYYGDTRCIADVYATCLRYLDYLRTTETPEGYLTKGLGDWVFYRAQTPNEYTSTAIYYLDYCLMARFAKLLGKDEMQFVRKADTIRTLLNRKFFNEETGVYANGTQTAQAMALYLGFVPTGSEQKVAEQLHKVVEANDCFLDFGLLGCKYVPAMLAKYGYVEDAFRMLTKETAPSWGHWVKEKGYSTLAETWTLSPEFKDASLNHVFMGDVSAWMYNVLAGINYDEQAPGFRNIIIRPHFVKDLDWVKGEYRSVAGLIRSEWVRKNGKITLTVEVPAGATATVYARDEKKVGAGTHTFVID